LEGKKQTGRGRGRESDMGDTVYGMKTHGEIQRIEEIRGGDREEDTEGGTKRGRDREEKEGKTEERRNRGKKMGAKVETGG
jgi:hypothetical protein